MIPLLWKHLLPIAERFLDYAYEVARVLGRENIRCEVDPRAEKIGYKIREAQLDRVPYMISIGQKEVDAGEISVRSRDHEDVGSMLVSQLIERFHEELGGCFK